MAVAKSSAGRSSLGSASASGRSRVCKKLVLKGQASSQGASYVLYLKLDLTSTYPDEVVSLITESGVELQEAHVFRLDTAGSVPALSSTAVAAAKNLNIPLSLSNNAASQRNLPGVSVRDDGCIQLIASTEASLYMAALHVRVKLLSKPPYGPFVVRLPKPFCLNNYLRFTVDESIAGAQDMQQVAVEVDPPILSPRRSSGRSSRASEMGTSDDGDMTILEPPSDDSDSENDGATIQGPFRSCDAVVLRFASDQAGGYMLDDSNLVLPNALRADSATSIVAYTPVLETEDGAEHKVNTVSFQATVELTRPYYAGLEHEVFLYLQLDSAGSSVNWLPTAVDASRGILSWTMGGVPSSEVDEERPAIPLPGRAVDNLVWPDLSLGESVDDEDLLKVAPLSGLNHAGLDFSLDLGAPSTGQQSRFALSSPAVGNKVQSANSRSLVTSNVLIVGFSLLPLVQSAEPVTISVTGHVDLGEECVYPGLRMPSVQHQSPSQVIVHDHLRTQPDEPVEEKKPNAPIVPASTSAPVVEDILQQVLAAIQAREIEPKPPSPPSRTDVVFRISHLLWTLLLTYMMVSLFTASQTANQALHVKIDHLSRLLEQRMAHAAPIETPATRDENPWLADNDEVTRQLDSLTAPFVANTNVIHTSDPISVVESFAAIMAQTVLRPLAFLRHLLFVLFRI